MNVKHTSKLATTLLAVSIIGFMPPTYGETEKHHEVAIHNNAAIHLFLKHDLNTTNISVNTSGHILQVVGFVDTQAELQKLEEVLINYKDHERVFNNVKVLQVHDTKHDESDLKTRTLSALKEANLPTDDIDLQIRNGHVIIGGFINKHVDADLFGSVAQQVPGVHKVDNFVLYKS